MYAPDQNQSPAPALDRRSTTTGRSTESFRPVALPALAAAVLVSAVAGKAMAARAKAARIAARFEHEDAPQV
ncbi:hypothetical protein PMNALOAF_1161 [Methylobacterium adhaesivum]|jgi:hypothetical protein|uniref:Uncharacterized protein n=1 Tax=Methylobacterium adhaesivum TaxID=333297 RepID=A0ABT8BGV3_9HYPH|nr:hypothetical protein [Methylobacterium adhaesivum]MDN3590692.1 hypothetical protein [Methylobacterium adhaesivum]GJD29919.1 hypothetical protein PMNALOAF_1161 [Methylobacterium adhaesivum]